MIPRPADRLAIDLLMKEDRFEKALTVEHVEDTLINKQVAMKDEESWVRTPERLSGVREFSDLNDTDEAYPWNFVYEILGDIALVNRQRRNFRLVRDWGGGVPGPLSGGRPW
jgi:hypothetical protein